MKTLSRELRPLFLKALEKAYPDFELGEFIESLELEEPRDSHFGDFASSIALKLAKPLNASPLEIAKKIQEAFPKDSRLEKVEWVAPGFINVKLSLPYLLELLSELEGGFYLERLREPKDRPVIIEYCGANAAKPLGAHHIITTILGESLSNLFEFMGYSVKRLNHLGDWGTHFGKMLYAVETWGDKEAIHKNPNTEFLKLYVQFNKEAESHPELEEEARKLYKALEDGDELRLSMWRWMVSESTEDLNRVLSRLGIHFHETRGESQCLEASEEIIKEGIQEGLFVQGEGGALIFNMGEDQVPAMIRKADNTTLYLTRDLATIRYRVEKWHPTEILYVVDHAQSLHFKQVFTVAKALGEVPETELEHISFGRMSFADRSMSTRKGNVIILDELLDEAVRRAEELAKDKDPALAELVGISALKYGILAQDRNKDIIFDWDRIITLDGNSAPYLLYTYARAHHILEKDPQGPGQNLESFTHPKEIEVMRLLIKFPEVLERALVERKPHHIAHYLHALAQSFNRFYGDVPVLTAESESARDLRLALVRAVNSVLQTGLGILDIPVVEKM